MSIHDLPLEILGQIAGESRAAFRGLITAFPTFARGLTIDKRLDFAVGFGHTVRVERQGTLSAIVWRLNGEEFRADGHAIDFGVEEKPGEPPAADRTVYYTRKYLLDRWRNFDKWYYDSKLHRMDGPAVEFTSGRKEWYQIDTLRRTDAPTVELNDGAMVWYQHSLRRRTDAPTVVASPGWWSAW